MSAHPSGLMLNSHPRRFVPNLYRPIQCRLLSPITVGGSCAGPQAAIIHAPSEADLGASGLCVRCGSFASVVASPT
jgi:hypothetical protein